MSPALIISLGFLAVASSLTLARMEHALTEGEARVANPLGDALSVLISWCAFAGLFTAALYRLGLAPAAVVAFLPLILGRLLPSSARFQPLFPLKLALAGAALILAIAALLGVVSLIEGAFLNG